MAADVNTPRRPERMPDYINCRIPGISHTMCHPRLDTTPPVSVIIPTYNRGWILHEALESVLAQDYPDFELIVVDDGSTDRTPAVLQRYGNRLRVLAQKNRGVSAARNRGIAAAKANLIAFLDSDDLWLPGKLKAQVDFFQHHPGALICQTEEIWIRNGVRVNPAKRHRKPSGMIFEASLHLCLVSPSAVMVRRRLFEQVGIFDESLPACEDYDLWLRVGCRYPIHLIETPLVVKRGGHADQLSRQPVLDRYRIQSLLRIIRIGRLNDEQQSAAARVLKEKCRIYAKGCRKRGRLKEAEHYEALAQR
jgi:glycosyltransferase involved in cell wall biosynthesis